MRGEQSKLRKTLGEGKIILFKEKKNEKKKIFEERKKTLRRKMEKEKGGYISRMKINYFCRGKEKRWRKRRTIFREGNNFLAEEKKSGEGKEENIWRGKILVFFRGEGKHLENKKNQRRKKILGKDKHCFSEE